MGTRNTSDKGNPCLVWAEVDPDRDKPDYRLNFPDRSISAASNYCREPRIDNPVGPFCYVSDENGGIKTEPCTLHMCCKYMFMQYVQICFITYAVSWFIIECNLSETSVRVRLYMHVRL